MKNIKYYLKKAQEEHFAIGQFNFSDFSQMRAICDAGAALKSPIILGTSEGESKFFGLEEAVAIRDVLRKKTGLPIFLNLDHGKSFEYLKEAIDAGYDMVHFDGSKLPLEENIKITKEVVKYAKNKGVTVEGEVGRIGTDSSKIYLEKFEIKEVKDGYGRNFLIIRGLAEIATKEALNKLEAQKKIWGAEHEKLVLKLKEEAGKIETLSLNFKMKTGEKGETFGSISRKDIETELAKHDYKNLKIELEKPIKGIGEHSVVIDLGEGIKAKLKILTEAE